MRRIRPQVEDDWIPPSLDNRLSRKNFFFIFTIFITHIRHFFNTGCPKWLGTELSRIVIRSR